MTCQNCARHVTETVQSVSGVRSASVDLNTGRASVRWNAGAGRNIPAIINAVRKAGYAAKEIPAGTSGGDKTKAASWQITLWLGVVVTAVLMTGEWVFGQALTPWFQWLAFALAGVVQIFAGAKFYRGAWNQLKIGSSNMDTLVALGSTTAFGYSAWALLSGAGGHVYFMEAAAIITLISFGHWLEARVSLRASGALKQLLQLAPQTARRLQNPESRTQNPESRFLNLKTPAFSESAARNSQFAIEVPVAELVIGDLVVLKPGDRVPMDGVVTEGDSAVDEAMLTGESTPADK